jgi:hypothetical protein
MTTEATLDAARTEEFAGKVIGMLNGAMLGPMVSVGHRTGLFDTMAGLAPSTSDRSLRPPA